MTSEEMFSLFVWHLALAWSRGESQEGSDVLVMMFQQ